MRTRGRLTVIVWVVDGGRLAALVWFEVGASSFMHNQSLCCGRREARDERERNEAVTWSNTCSPLQDETERLEA
jgi:hypothetical protein